MGCDHHCDSRNPLIILPLLASRKGGLFLCLECYEIVNKVKWQGEKDCAIVISAEQALQEILKSGNHDLLETKKFRELKELYEKQMVAEEEDELEEEEEK